MRVIESRSLSTNEFALTGESAPTSKHTSMIRHDVALADRRNLAFAGTTVATGEGIGLVTAIGMDTELGRIARLSEEVVVPKSPLQVEIGRIARLVGTVVVALSAVVMAVGLFSDMPFREALLFAVGLACALIPQGLPAEVNTALAQASAVLARQGALVKRLSSVETLGATAVICTDKTGTLTKNEMSVVELFIGRQPFLVEGTGYAPNGGVWSIDGQRLSSEDWHRELFRCGVLASNAEVLPHDEDHAAWWVRGDPTEGALVTLATKAGVDPGVLRDEQVEARALPFDAVRRRMTSVRQDPEGGCRAWVKGAPESVLARATTILDGGVVRPLTDEDRQFIDDTLRARAHRCLRNLALAVREVSAEAAHDRSLGPDDFEQDLTLLGVVSMLDPLRDEVPEAIHAAQLAHVRVNILTGDAPATAAAIARAAGIDQLDGDGEGPVTITADALHAMDDEELRQRLVSGGLIFSRVSPEDKLRIVEAVKGSAVVAVTGDGINDAPALRSASIGVAMGRSGTDVAKQSADIILLDDSFVTLVGAVREGRRIYANIAKGVLSCLTSNVAEFVVNTAGLIVALLAGFPLAINILQILAIDLLGEILPIAALGSDKQEGESMRRHPRPERARILNGRSLADVTLTGTVIGLLALGAYFLSFKLTGTDPRGLDGSDPAALTATTATYTTILVTQLVNIVDRRSGHGLATRYQLSNGWFWGAVGVAVAVMLVIVYVAPVARFFDTAPLGGFHWLYVAAAALVVWAARRGIRDLTRQPQHGH